MPVLLWEGGTIRQGCQRTCLGKFVHALHIIIGFISDNRDLLESGMRTEGIKGHAMNSSYADRHLQPEEGAQEQEL